MSGDVTGSIKLWDVQANLAANNHSGYQEAREFRDFIDGQAVTGLALSADGLTLVSGNYGQEVEWGTHWKSGWSNAGYVSHANRASSSELVRLSARMVA